MKNHEKYREQLIEVLARGRDFGFCDNKITRCNSDMCKKCKFSPDELTYTCYESRKAWLNAEYVEQPKLTKKERQLCEFIKEGYLARDASGSLYSYEEKPIKKYSAWDGTVTLYLNQEVFESEFSFIKWEDEEPWSIQGLLELEVEE